VIDGPSFSAQQCGQASIPEALPLSRQFRQASSKAIISFATQLSLLCGARQLGQPASAAFADPMLLDRDCHRGPLACRF